MARAPTKRLAAPPPAEFELGLEAPRAVVEALASGGGGLSERATQRRLRELYFDTAEAALWRAGLALRIREQRSRFLQTVKRRSVPTAGLFERLELASASAGPEPDLARIADPALAAELRVLCGEQPLAPVLETESVRSVRRVAFEGARIEVVCNVGEARVASGSFPISRVELELKSGDPAALFRLALALREKHPDLRPALRDVTGAPLEALYDAAPSVMRARPLELSRGADCEALRRAALAECLRAVTGSAARAGEVSDAESIHVMRVGVRRLRGALRLFRDELPAERAAWLRAALEPLMDALGAVRELDVFLALLDSCRSAGGLALDDPRERCARERAAAVEALRELLAAPESAQLVLELGSLAFEAAQPAGGAGPFALGSAREHARELAAACDRRARKAGRSFATAGEAELHRLRLRVKSARYAVELLAPLLPAKRAQRYVRRAAELQQLLGDVTDASAARQLLARLCADGDRLGEGFVAGWVARDATLARGELIRAWKRFRRVRRPW
jgi:inorganic triphosphatase YgiF